MKNNRDIRILIKKVKKLSHRILLNAILIAIISAFTIYSATYTRTTSFLKKDLIWLFLGILVYFLFAMIDFKLYRRYSRLIYGVSLTSLVAVFAFGVTKLGAKRWIDLGFMNLQPSEFAKIFMVLTFSALLVNRYKTSFSGLKDVAKSGVHILPVFILILKQPDLGTSLTLIAIFGVLIFVHGIDTRTIIVMLGSLVAFVPFAYFFLLKEYQQTRILTFLNPEQDLLGSGWNVTQSMIAVGSGGLFGKGIFQGTQSKLKFLPESHTDFIGAVFLEETGFVGGLLLLVLYYSLIYNIVRIGNNSNDEYGRLICYGVAAIVFFHTTVNLGMIIGLMPVTGLPLLLMSYGGSSYIFTFMMLGIVQSVKVHSDKY
ncbi:MAG: rod shape-determining protein RodA [Psychrilyobacter sp.]|uniref:rod shape-determining protein RodA n=1 Tax=Psychrilyobacter sp. TaxID=2586924 RepID=UPI003C70E85B